MTFQSNRKVSVNSVLKQYLPIVVFIILLLIYNLIFPQYAFVFKRNYFWIVLLIPLSFAGELIRERLSEIRFDDEKRLIIFFYKSAVSKPRMVSLSYQNAAVEIYDSTSVEKLFGKSQTVYFFEGDFEIAKINNRRDGFSADTIKQICDKVNRLTSEDK